MASKPRVFSTCDIGAEALDRLRRRGYQLEVYAGPEPPPYDLILQQLEQGIDGLITTLRDRIDEQIFRLGAGRLKVVAQDAVGVDNIDLKAANRYRVPVCYTPEVLTQATAEFAFFMMGCAARRLYPSEVLVREGRWETWHPWHPFLGDEVTGKTVAVVGVGRIGQAFASKCLGLDMNLLLVESFVDLSEFTDALRQVVELRRRTKLAGREAEVRHVELDEALPLADFVSLHVPLTEETRALISEPQLRAMKSSAYLINTSRGPVVDEKALHRALVEGWIGGAALDVFEKEPLPEDSPLRDPALSDRLRLFHHFASGTKETRLSVDPERGMAGRCVQGLIDVLEGRYGGDPSRMPYVVNKAAF